ncbi:MAG TPA: phosphatidylserine/phosphatidylglycerophosphate/cardiolipin synthase family protein [Candidatus Dormibacteraeota bacterium]|nr:phosphatidylserine/phosphatidylglycerophosphate/cardiolipin synthase family protein [Candidatus Dormibacteraeota bacterium]
MVRVVRVWALLLSLCLVGCSGPASTLPPVLTVHRAAAAQPVHLWQDASIFKLISGLISHARHRVLVEVYEIGRNDLIEEMAQARARSIDTRVITDPTVAASRASAARLALAGVPLRFYPVDDSAHQIDHVKLLIADDQAAVGGMNWGAHSSRNHDYVLETGVTDDVTRLARIFEQDWSLAGGLPAPLPPVLSEVAQTSPGEEIRAMLEGAIRGARRNLLSEIYTLTDPDVLAELASAKRRGVDVRVLLDPNQAYNRLAFDILRASGVPVRWYPIPAGALLHAKIALADDELVLGSANWTYSGLDVNHELDIETSDPEAAAAYGSRFEQDWARSPA